MHEILDGQNVIFAKAILNNRVIGQRDTLTINFAVATLVDQLADCLQVGLSGVTVRYRRRVSRADNIPVSDIGLYQTEHLLRRLRHTYKHAAVNLQKAEKL